MQEIEDFSIGQVIEVTEDLIGTSVDVTGRSSKGFLVTKNEIILDVVL